MKLKSLAFYMRKPHIAVKKFFYNLFIKKNPDLPWFEPRAVEFLDQYLTKDMSVFEWGSGRSTAWLAKRAKDVISIEYGEGWYKKVAQDLENNGLKNTDLRYIPVDNSPTAPTNYDTRPFPPYVESIDGLGPFDLVIVDGHYRRTCVKAALDRLKPGGLLLIDDSHREPSYATYGVPESWLVAHESSNGFMQTTLLKKPL